VKYFFILRVASNTEKRIYRMKLLVAMIGLMLGSSAYATDYVCELQDGDPGIFFTPLHFSIDDAAATGYLQEYGGVNLFYVAPGAYAGRFQMSSRAQCDFSLPNSLPGVLTVKMSVLDFGQRTGHYNCIAP
jgi:hypothetical protein